MGRNIRPYPTRALPTQLYRVGYATDPAGLRPWKFIPDNSALSGRFDDPYGEYRVLYLTDSPAAALREKLMSHRSANIGEFLNLEPADLAEMPSPEVPASFLTAHVLTTIKILGSSRVVDVTHSGAFDSYCDETDRRLTVDDVLDNDSLHASQHLGHAVWSKGECGLVYPSKHGTDLTNYALFETGHKTNELHVKYAVTEVQPLDATCEILKEVADQLQLQLRFPNVDDPRLLWVYNFRDALKPLGLLSAYERNLGRGVMYYSYRIPGAKLTAMTFTSAPVIHIETVTSAGGATVDVEATELVSDTFAKLAVQDESVATALLARR